MHEDLLGSASLGMKPPHAGTQKCLDRSQTAPRVLQSFCRHVTHVSFLQAYRKFKKEHPDGATHLPTVTVPDPSSIV